VLADLVPVVCGKLQPLVRSLAPTEEFGSAGPHTFFSRNALHKTKKEERTKMIHATTLLGNMAYQGHDYDLGYNAFVF
jgi:hypothetical protein